MKRGNGEITKKAANPFDKQALRLFSLGTSIFVLPLSGLASYIRSIFLIHRFYRLFPVRLVLFAILTRLAFRQQAHHFKSKPCGQASRLSGHVVVRAEFH